jgi:hypothetical protein
MTKKLRYRELLMLAFLFVVLHYTPFGFMNLCLDVTSSTSGKTQLFYPSISGQLSEANSFRRDLRQGFNALSFELSPGIPWVRWDPIDGPGTFQFHSIALIAGPIKLAIPFTQVSRGAQIARIVSSGQTLVVETELNATDPSVSIDLPFLKSLVLQEGFLLILVLGVGLLYIRLRWLHLQTKTALSTLSSQLAPQVRSFLVLFIVCVFLYLPELTSFSISIDDEYAAFREAHEVWISQGRWLAFLIARFVMPQSTVPFLPTALFCLSAAFSYVCLVLGHGYQMRLIFFLLFPLFSAWPIWIYVGEFYANLPAVSVGLALTSVAVLLYNSRELSAFLSISTLSTRTIVIMSALLVGTAMASYQSFLFAFISMALGIVIVRMLSGRITRAQILFQLSSLICIIIISLAWYFGSTWSLLRMYDLQISYIDGFVRPEIILQEPGKVILSTVNELWQIYSGSQSVYGVSLGAAGFLFLIGIMAILTTSKLTLTERGLGLVLGAGAAASPFTLTLLVGGAASIPLRSLVGVPYIVWLFSALAVTASRTPLRVIGIATLSFAIFQVVYGSTLFQASNQLTREHDRALAAEVYRRVVALHSNFDRQQIYKIDFYGAKTFTSPYPKVFTSTIGSSFFEWDGGNPYRIVAFMRLLGYDNLQAVTPDQRRNLLAQFEQMPIWPAAGSTIIVDGVTLVKLNGRPGLTHQFQTPN